MAFVAAPHGLVGSSSPESQPMVNNVKDLEVVCMISRRLVTESCGSRAMIIFCSFCIHEACQCLNLAGLSGS